MDFRQVRYLLAVAEHRSFRRAAETVHVAQSALSRHISELEERLEVRLFDRLPSGVMLTQAGYAYAEEARRAVEMMERAETRAQMAARGEIDRLAIGLNDIGARNRPLAHGIVAFSAAYPEVQLDLLPMISQAQVAALRSAKIDAGVLIDRPEDAALDHIPLVRDPFCLALPAAHPLAAQPSVPVSSLVGEPFVSVAMSTYWLPQTRLFARCRALGLSPRIVQEVSNDQMQMSLVAAGLGVAFVNASMASAVGGDVVLRPVEHLDVALNLDLVWKRGTPVPSLANFIRVVASRFG